MSIGGLIFLYIYKKNVKKVLSTHTRSLKLDKLSDRFVSVVSAFGAAEPVYVNS